MIEIISLTVNYFGITAESVDIALKDQETAKEFTTYFYKNSNNKIPDEFFNVGNYRENNVNMDTLFSFKDIPGVVGNEQPCFIIKPNKKCELLELLEKVLPKEEKSTAQTGNYATSEVDSSADSSSDVVEDDVEKGPRYV